jgi:hypothetical protein
VCASGCERRYAWERWESGSVLALTLASVSGAGAVCRRILSGMVLRARARVGLGRRWHWCRFLVLGWLVGVAGMVLNARARGTGCVHARHRGRSITHHKTHCLLLYTPPCILLALHPLWVALCLSQVVGVRDRWEMYLGAGVGGCQKTWKRCGKGTGWCT